ncbi:hypothetical protein A2U01_0112578, partial [Trifolium medium]|nr:hypothetical protein [Trifolium medium]
MPLSGFLRRDQAPRGVPRRSSLPRVAAQFVEMAFLFPRNGVSPVVECGV